ncbi:upf0103-like protein [Alternaria alternata]|nr:upf0103-like protein [Alternaria alternata]
MPTPTSPYNVTITAFNIPTRAFRSIFPSLKPNMVTRKATHAGSWYTDNKQLLSQQLDGWLGEVPESTTPIGSASSQQDQVSIPTPHARAIIAPYVPRRLCREDEAHGRAGMPDTRTQVPLQHGPTRALTGRMREYTSVKKTVRVPH